MSLYSIYRYSPVCHTEPRKPAPVHSTGAKCLGRFRPNRLANQRITRTAMGERRRWVWWRKGNAVVIESETSTVSSTERGEEAEGKRRREGEKRR